jgi:UDP-N-acetylglucosamine transferase subunit ALG13
VITPAHNEAAHLPAVAKSMIAQRRPPDLWLVVDDGSTDDTLAVARRLARKVSFMRVLQAPTADVDPATDRLAVALEARAFNWGLGHADASEFGFIGKLDADVALDAGHFERLLEEFRSDPKLGIAGTYIEEDDGRGWTVNQMPPYHVNGAVKLYRRSCLERIGGVPEVLAWDTLDETHARMAGFSTRSFEAPIARHLRRSGSAAGLLRGKARHGECVWLANYPFALVVARTAKMIGTRPFGLAAGAFLWGYARAALRRRGRVDDPELLRFARQEQWRRIRTTATSVLRRTEVCLPTSHGGHFEELEALAPAYSGLTHVFLMPRSPRAQQLRASGVRVAYLSNPQRNPFRLLLNAAQALRLVLTHRPRVVVTTGAGLAVPFCLFAKLLGARVIFIETMARVDQGSATGRSLYRIADHFLVQWPELLVAYPSAEVCRPALLEQLSTQPRGAGRGSFIAVGNHNQPFNRLLRLVEQAGSRGLLPEPVSVQAGCTSVRPGQFEVAQTVSPDEVTGLAAERRLIVCHGGAGLIATALKCGRKPVVLPRRRDLGEHVDDHQVVMTARLSALGLVLSLDEMDLQAAVARADEAPHLREPLPGPGLADRLAELVAGGR